jgi:hypothetical protein
MARPQPPPATIREAVALFDDAASLDAGISDLLGNGFDRADISFMARDDLEQRGDVRRAEDDPTVKRAPVVTDTDVHQSRTLAVSLIATVVGFAAAGFTVVTGGAATLAGALAAALAGGVGATVGKVLGDSYRKYLEQHLARGGVIVWVRLRDAAAEQRALDILRRYSAHDVHVHEIPDPAHA